MEEKTGAINHPNPKPLNPDPVDTYEKGKGEASEL